MGATENTVVEFVENYFRRPLDRGLVEDLASRRARFDPDDLSVAYSAWRQCTSAPARATPEWGRHWAFRFEPTRLPPAKPREHLRPYLPVETQPASGKPNTGYFVFDNTEQECWSTVDAIKHHLLYCHSVAIEDPLANWMADRSTGGMAMSVAVNLQRGLLGWKFNSPMIMARWVSFLAHVRPLIESGALVIVEAPARLPYILEPVKGIDEEVLEATAREMNLSVLQLRLSLKKLTLLVQARARAQGGLDLDLSDPAVAALASALLARRRDERGPLKVRESAMLSTFIDAKLPALERLRIEDLVAVRQSGDEFERWRRGIEAITRRIDAERVEGLPPGEWEYELSRRFRAEVLDLQRELAADVSRTSARSRVTQAVVKFGVGAAVGAVCGWPLGLAFVAAEQVRDFAKTAVEALVDTEWKSRSTAQEALAGLFVAFQDG